MNVGRVLIAKRKAAEEQIEPTGRFDRSQEGVEPAVPVQNPA